MVQVFIQNTHVMDRDPVLSLSVTEKSNPKQFEELLERCLQTWEEEEKR